MLVGTSDTGKSLFCRQLLVDIVLGRDTFLGKKINLKYGKAAIISTEDFANDWKQKLHLYKFADNEIPLLSNLRIAFDTNQHTLNLLRDWIQNNPVDLLILDTMCDMYSHDINDTVKVRVFLEKFKKLARDFDTAVVITHHLTKKGSSTQMPSKLNVLGSQAIESAARNVLELREHNTDPQERVLHITKSNYLSSKQKKEPIILRLVEPELRFVVNRTVFCTANQDIAQMPVKYRIKELMHRYSIRELTETLKDEGYKIGKTKVSEIIKELKNEEGKPQAA